MFNLDRIPSTQPSIITAEEFSRKFGASALEYVLFGEYADANVSQSLAEEVGDDAQFVRLVHSIPKQAVRSENPLQA